MKEDALDFPVCGEISPDPLWGLAPHMHSFHELIAVKSGSMLLKTRHGELVATGGDVLFYEAGMVHEEISQPDDPVNTLFMAFRMPKSLPSPPLRTQDPEGRVTELISWLIRDRIQGRPSTGCLSIVQAIIEELHWIQRRPEDPWLKGVREYLRDNLAAPLTLEQIALKGKMSRFAFIRKFKRLSGRTPMEELRRLRLQKARDLILSRDWPLKAIGPAVGIGDEYQLSKLFRRHFGLSPGQMRGKPRA